MRKEVTMHKLLEYICDELEELDRKAGKEGKLSMAEIEYADKLAHIKKSILASEEMWEDSEYSMAGAGSGQSRMMGGSSYRRGGSSRRGGGGSSREGGGSSREGSSYEGGSSREGGSSYEEGGSSREGSSSYARGRGRNARRDSRGRYSSEYSMDSEEMVEQLRELMQDAPDQQTRQEFQKFIQKIEQM